MFKYDVDVALGWGGRLVLAWPLDADVPERAEGLDEADLGHVPGNASEEDFAGIDGVGVVFLRQEA